MRLEQRVEEAPIKFKQIPQPIRRDINMDAGDGGTLNISSGGSADKANNQATAGNDLHLVGGRMDALSGQPVVVMMELTEGILY